MEEQAIEPQMPEPDWPKLPKPDLGSGYSASLLYAYAASCARLATAAERERCAKVCESLVDPVDPPWNECLRECAAAIRKG